MAKNDVVSFLVDKRLFGRNSSSNTPFKAAISTRFGRNSAKRGFSLSNPHASGITERLLIAYFCN